MSHPSPAQRGRVGERSEPGGGLCLDPHPVRRFARNHPPPPGEGCRRSAINETNQDLGSRRRRPRRTPKGRQVDPTALEEVRALLGERPRRRDLLIEHLHLIQDRYGCLSAAHLAALAQEMRLALTEVYEVPTFYAHFHVVQEDQTPPPHLP